MGWRSLGWVTVLAACSPTTGASPDAAPDVVPDVAIDADRCASPYTLAPVALTGTSPRGSLDSFHYAVAGYTTCPDSGMEDGYMVAFIPSKIALDCAPTTLSLWIFTPSSTAGTHAARAILSPPPSVLTDMVTFEATQLDPPGATPSHIVGRFVSRDPAWAFDLPVDLTTQFSASCL
jgi:hypothetical protein